MRKIGWEGFWSVMGLVPVFEKFEGRQSLCPPSQSPQIPPLQGFTPPPPPFFRIVFLTAFFSSHSGFASPLLSLPILVLLHTNLEPSLTEVMPTLNNHLSDQVHSQVTKLDPRLHQVRWCLSPLWRVTSSTPEPGLEPPRAHCAAARHRPAVNSNLRDLPGGHLDIEHLTR